MVRKSFLIVAFAALFLWIAPAQGGGCCLVMTLDALPGEVRAGEEVQVGFMMRLNEMPLSAQHPFLVVANPQSGEQIEVAAEPTGTPGHYIAAVTFSAGGVWQWELRASRSGQGQVLPPLTVLPPAATAAGASASPVETVRAVLRWSALALGLAAAFLLLRDRLQRNAPAVAPIREWSDA